MTVGEAIVGELTNWGVSAVYGVAGSAYVLLGMRVWCMRRHT
jgi:thiamine pyrophosphate-dependent acetolactate synthase large subunit-like protein